MTYALRVSTHSRSGFTLVELSIVIIIVGLLTAGGLAVGSSMVERAAYIDTQKLIAGLQNSVKDYYIVNGRLPCVASFDDMPGSSDFGTEVFDPVATPSNCADSATVPAGTFRRGSPAVRIGMIPSRALGLPDSAASDKYGNRIVYAVAAKLTDANQFGAEPGAITVEDMGDNAMLTDGAFFIGSVGRDREGGYDYKTTSINTPCDTSSTSLDVHNCDYSDAIFRDAPYNNGDVDDQFFDDITAWTPKFHLTGMNASSDTLWAANGDANLYSVGIDTNTTDTNVGIGTPAPDQKLHVVGNSLTEGDLFLQQDTPTVYFQDTDHRSAMIHGNSDRLYFLRGNGVGSTAWDSARPLTIDLVNSRVGIGTENPSAFLNFSNVTGDKIYLWGTTGSQYGFGVYSSELRNFAGSSGMTTFGNQNAGTFTERMRLTGTGNLGVGTTAPAERIHTNGDIRTDGRTIHLGANQRIYGSGSTSFYLDSGSTYNYLRWRDNSSTTLGYIYGSPTHFRLVAGSSTRLSFSRDGSTSSYIYGNPSSALDQRLVVMGTGSFTNGAFMYLNGRNLDNGNFALVAATNSTGAVTTHSFGRYPSSGGPNYHSMAHLLANGDLALEGSVIPLSDERAKKDITVLENALEKVSALRGVTYRWNGKGGHEDLTTEHIGVIAQDVQRVFPEAIAELPNSELMAVKYDYLIPPLIEAVKELKAENDALRQRLDGMDASTGDAPMSPQQEAVMQAPSDALLRWMNLALMVVIACLAYALYRRR